jgi:hypothetical protein
LEQGLHLNRGTGGLRLYVGEFNRLWGYPESFRQRLEAAVGPWPGMPDGPALADWWLDAAEGIDLDTFMEQAERLDRYIDAATAWVLANEEAQLLLAYHPTPGCGAAARPPGGSAPVGLVRGAGVRRP